MQYPKLICALAAAALLAGCHDVVDRRISAHRETWLGLSEQDRQRLRQGHVRAGDTEEMVSIALGPPDEVRPITSLEGQKQTVWLYDLLELESSSYSLFDPAAPAAVVRMPDREQSVFFHDGIVVDQRSISSADIARLPELRTDATTEYMVTRLDSLVALSPEQKVKVRGIFARTNEELFAFSRDERPGKGMSIRVKMRADVRAMLTPEQQAKYDAAPQYLGGGSTRRP